MPLFWACPFGSGYRAVSFWAGKDLCFNLYQLRAQKGYTAHIPHAQAGSLPHIDGSATVYSSAVKRAIVV